MPWCACPQAQQPSPDVATLWLTPTGKVLSVDAAFTDWLGYRPTDIQGSAVAALAENRQLDV